MDYSLRHLKTKDDQMTPMAHLFWGNPIHPPETAAGETQWITGHSADPSGARSFCCKELCSCGSAGAVGWVLTDDLRHPPWNQRIKRGKRETKVLKETSIGPV